MVAEQDSPTQVAAFFDVDRTLLRGSSLLHVARPLRRAGILPARGVLRAVVAQARFSVFGFDDAQIHNAVRGAGAVVAGVRSTTLLEFARIVVPLYVLPRMYTDARSRMEWHRGRGDLIFLVSSSPREFISVLGDALGVDGVAATDAEMVDGMYNGRIVRLCHGDSKAEAVRELAAVHGVDLGLSYAYGDSYASDLAMLASVGHPVCVNPDRRLSVQAARNDWPVERFRRIKPSAGMGTRRGRPQRLLGISRPGGHRARDHVSNTARSLREL